MFKEKYHNYMRPLLSGTHKASWRGNLDKQQTAKMATGTFCRIDAHSSDNFPSEKRLSQKLCEVL